MTSTRSGRPSQTSCHDRTRRTTRIEPREIEPGCGAGSMWRSTSGSANPSGQVVIEEPRGDHRQADAEHNGSDDPSAEHCHDDQSRLAASIIATSRICHHGPVNVRIDNTSAGQRRYGREVRTKRCRSPARRRPASRCWSAPSQPISGPIGPIRPNRSQAERLRPWHGSGNIVRRLQRGVTPGARGPNQVRFRSHPRRTGPPRCAAGAAPEHPHSGARGPADALSDGGPWRPPSVAGNACT